MSGSIRKLLCVLAVTALVAPVVQTFDTPEAEAGPQAWYATVTAISDGDTIEVDWHGSGRPSGMAYPDRIRFVGVDTNEVTPGECFADAATDFVRARVPVGSVVRLEADHKGSSADGRALRHVFYGNNYQRNLGMELVEAGLGLAASYQAEPAYREGYYRAGERAHLAEAGMWEPGACGGKPNTFPELDVRVNYEAPGLDANNLNGEYVRIRNLGPGTLRMNDWSIRKGGRVGPNGQHQLPDRTVPEGGQLTIYSGRGTNSSTEVYLGLSEPYLRNETDVVYLRDQHLNVRFFKVWPCQLTCANAGTLVVDHIFPDAPGPDNKNPNGEWARLRNRGVDTVDLTGWKIQTNRSVFRFPAGTTVAAGDTLEIRMGRGQHSAQTLHWGSKKSVLSNSGGKLRISNKDSEKVDCFAWGRAKCKNETVRGAVVMTTHYDATGNDNAHPEREWISFENTSDGPINLSRFTVQVGSDTYRFEKGTRIAAGKRLRLKIGKGRDKKYNKYWGRSGELLQNDGGAVQLLDRTGAPILEHRWLCGDCGADGPFVIDQVRFDAPGADNNNLNGEWVVIRNAGPKRASLRDYVIGADANRLIFSKHRWVGAGDSIRVRMGRGSNKADTIYWKQSSEVLRNQGSRVTLRSPSREIVDCHAWGDKACPGTEQGVSTGLAMRVNYDAEGNDAENPNGEWVDLRNTSTGTISLAGHSLASGGGVYEFAATDVISPGQRLRIHRGSGVDTGLSRFAGSDLPPLSNVHDEVMLLNPEGYVALHFKY